MRILLVIDTVLLTDVRPLSYVIISAGSFPRSVTIGRVLRIRVFAPQVWCRDGLRCR